MASKLDNALGNSFIIGNLLDLNRNLTLQPANQKANDFLNKLEQEGVLPLTVAWLDDQGMKHRLYAPPFFGGSSFELNKYGFRLGIHVGLDESEFVGYLRYRIRNSGSPGNQSKQLPAPARLPAAILLFLQSLASFDGVEENFLKVFKYLGNVALN
jgi:hypothetical protein